MALALINEQAVKPLVVCIQEPEIELKRFSAQALSEIAKHSDTTATEIVNSKAVGYLAALISHPDAKLKRYVCQCLAYIAFHDQDRAENVAESEIFPRIYNCLKGNDLEVRRQAA